MGRQGGWSQELGETKRKPTWFVNSTESLREGACWLWGGTIWVKSWELGATAVQPCVPGGAGGQGGGSSPISVIDNGRPRKRWRGTSNSCPAYIPLNWPVRD